MRNVQHLVVKVIEYEPTERCLGSFMYSLVITPTRMLHIGILNHIVEIM